MDRFHIVVSNYKRLFCFVDNFHRIQGFDGQRDRVVIFDCSPDPDWQEQLAIAGKLTSFRLRWGDNLHFVRRRNWNQNMGAQLDYCRCMQDQTIPTPEYAAFVRFYSVEAFMRRVVQHRSGLLLKVIFVENEKEVDPSCYCKFVTVFERSAESKVE